MKEIRYDDNKIDKILFPKYVEEFKKFIDSSMGLNDMNKVRMGFDKYFCKAFHLTNGISVSSGTDAIHLSFLASGITKGDEVIISDLNYPSGPAILRWFNAMPIVIDVDDGLKMDIEKLEEAISDKTKAVFITNMFGKPSDIQAINKLVKRYGIIVIEDSCQSLGSIYEGDFCGTKSDFSCFSFAYIKPFSSAGGGGGFISCSKEHIDKIDSYYYIRTGKPNLLELYNSFIRINYFDIASIKVKLNIRKEILKSRIKCMKLYDDLLGEIKNIEVFRDNQKEISIMQTYLILADKRDALYAYLRSKRIIADLPYAPIHKLGIFEDLRIDGAFPNTERYYQNGLHLPLFSFMKEEEIHYVADMINVFFMDNKKD